MALDKLVDSTQLDNNLTSIANAIRAKTGSTATLAFPAGFTTEITAIQTGGNYIAKTVTPNDTVQIISKDDEIRTADYTSTIISRTINSSPSFAFPFTPVQALVDNENYWVLGRIDVINSSNTVLESYYIDTQFTWSTNRTTVAINDANAYCTNIQLKKSSPTAISVELKCQKAGTYGFKITLSIREISGYDALSIVTVNAEKYSETWVKAYIERTISTITWPDGITSIGAYAFRECNSFNVSNLPSTIVGISTYAFYNCSNLTLTQLPNELPVINPYTFYNCTKLALTSLPSGITTIGDYAFYNCKKITISSLPNGLTRIYSYSFYNCSNLSLTSLPNSITAIDEYAFYSCTALALTSLPSNLTTIQSYAFYLCYSMTLTTLPSSLTYIGQYAFSHCISLLNIVCDGQITTLGQYAFNAGGSYSMRLQSARFPNLAITGNLGSVFGNTSDIKACKELVTVDIGNAPGIAANAFANCYALQTLILRKTSVASLANVSAFLNTPMRGYNSLTGTVYVPSSLISSYRTATNWSTLYNNGTVNFVAIEGSPYEL